MYIDEISVNNAMDSYQLLWLSYLPISVRLSKLSFYLFRVFETVHCLCKYKEYSCFINKRITSYIKSLAFVSFPQFILDSFIIITSRKPTD